jgi:hypothetical protein
VIRPSLDRIIQQTQSCIVDAKALQLKMPERILSIALLEAYENKQALLEAYENKQKSGNGRSGGELQRRRN